MHAMAVFECDRCGKCCVSLGSLITIERQLSDREYYCRNKIDNTLFPVRVDPAYCEEIADEFERGDSAPSSPGKSPCRFLRKNREWEGTVCAIYATRPKICRDFRCYHMLIRNHDGAVCGYLIGKNTIRTDDVTLEKLWTGQVAEIPYGDPAAWKKMMTGILAEHGYRADPVE
jgi:Fe-S-cluster containining protein